MILSLTKSGDDKTGFKTVLFHFIVPSILLKQYIPPSCVPIKIKSYDRHGDDERTLPFNFDFHFREPSESTQ